ARSRPLAAWIVLAVLAGMALMALSAVPALIMHRRSRRMQRERAGVRQQIDARLRSLTGGAVRAIVVYDKYGWEELKRITDRTALDDFVGRLADAQHHRPNHPVYFASWYVVVETEDGSQIELECHYENQWRDKVVCYRVIKEGNTTHYYGTFISAQLRPWFEQHVKRLGTVEDP
ncbi:hypothetical protein ACFL09_05525, partial [Planctomycetota bacterium]